MLGRDHGTRSLRDVLRTPRATPGTDTRCCHARPRRSPRWSRCSPSTGRPRRRSGCRSGRLPRAVGARRQPRVRRRPRPARRRGRGCRARIVSAQYDAARRAWREGFVAEAVDAFQRRPFRDSSGEAHAGRADRRRPGGLARVVRARRRRRRSAASRSRRPTSGGRVRCCSSRWRCSTRLPDEALDPSTVDGAHVDDRGAQARVRRPRGVVRRRQPGVRRRAARPGVRRRARWPWSATPPPPSCDPGSPGGRDAAAAPARAARGPDRSGRSGARRADRHAGPARPGATPATSTSSTAGATSSRRRRAAAGCRARRPCPSSASAWAAGCRCSGSTTDCPSSLAPGRRPRTTLSPTLVLRDGVPVLACGTPGRRPAGPVAAAVPAPPPRRRAGAAGGDRRADVPHDVVARARSTPARWRPGELVVEDRLGGRRDRGAGRGVDTASPGRGRGRWGGCARSRATRRPACSRPVPTRAASQGYACGR